VDRPGEHDEAEPGRRPTGAERRRAAAERLGATGAVADLLGRHMKDGRLVALPMKRASKLALLDFFASRFEPGKAYYEPQVNEMLLVFTDDPASIRRALVDEEFMERRDNFYWRAGGTFEVD
jgi:hypothetical protein